MFKRSYSCSGASFSESLMCPGCTELIIPGRNTIHGTLQFDLQKRKGRLIVLTAIRINLCRHSQNNSFSLLWRHKRKAVELLGCWWTDVSSVGSCSFRRAVTKLQLRVMLIMPRDLDFYSMCG